LEAEKGDGEDAARISSPDLPAADEPNQLLALAAEVIGRPSGEILGHVRPGVDANLATLAGGRFRNVIVRGARILGFVNADGEDVRWDSLRAGDRAVLLFAVQFTLWQVVASGPQARPVILDVTRASAGEEALLATSSQAAEFLSKKTQVLVLGG
jgi:hypothetical protein